MDDFELPKTIEEKEIETSEMELRKELEAEDKKAEEVKEEVTEVKEEVVEEVKVELPEKKDDSFDKNTGFLSIDVSKDHPVEEVKELEPIKPSYTSTMSNEIDESTRLLSKRSSMMFVCICVAVVCFCVGGIVGFYFGSKNAKIPEDTNKKVITVSSTKQIENNFINDPELVEVTDSMETSVEEKNTEQ